MHLAKALCNLQRLYVCVQRLSAICNKSMFERKGSLELAATLGFFKKCKYKRIYLKKLA